MTTNIKSALRHRQIHPTAFPPQEGVPLRTRAQAKAAPKEADVLVEEEGEEGFPVRSQYSATHPAPQTDELRR